MYSHLELLHETQVKTTRIILAHDFEMDKYLVLTFQNIEPGTHGNDVLAKEWGSAEIKENSNFESDEAIRLYLLEQRSVLIEGVSLFGDLDNFFNAH